MAGGALDVEEGDPPQRLRVWRPKPPSYCEAGRIKGRHWWMLVPWHVPQPSSFWRRELFDRFGMFRSDMHYAFDAEFMLRLAYDGETPELLSDEFLSIRWVHPEQKTYEMTNSRPEIARFVEIFTPHLSKRERFRLRASWALEPAARIRRLVVIYGVHYLLGPFMHRVVTPVLTWGGDLLEHLPKRWRPPIRIRDRQRKEGAVPASGSRNGRPYGPSPIGLEPIARDPGPQHVPEWPGGNGEGGQPGSKASDRTGTPRARGSSMP